MQKLTISDSISPIVFQLALGGLGGFLVGYALSRILKVALIIVAIVLSLILLAYLNLIGVNYDALSELSSNVVNAVNPALSQLAPLFAHVPFIASFIICFIIGFKRD